MGLSSYRREPITDEDIIAALALYRRELRPPKRGAVFCGECNDVGCDQCRSPAPGTR